MTYKKNSTILISFLLGALAASAFNNEKLFFLFLFSLVFWAFLLDYIKPSPSFLSGYSFGFGFFLAATWWLSMLEGYRYLPLLLSAYEALFFALPVVLSSYFFKKKDNNRFVLLFIFIFVFEVIRGFGRFGFPWMSAGFYLSGTIFRKSLYLYGVYGSSFLIYLLAGSIASGLIVNKKRTPYLILTAFLIFALFLPSFLHNEEIQKKWRFSLLQDTLLPKEKHAKEPGLREKLMVEHFGLMLSKIPNETSVVVFPETSFPYLYPFNEYWQKFLINKAREYNSYFLLGVESLESGRYYNSVLALSKDGIFDKYDKQHLVPFGEYLPFRDSLRILPSVRDTTDFSFGKRDGIFELDGLKVGIGICWESAVPGYGSDLARKGANVLAFVTNDNWFLFTNQSEAHWRHTKAQSDCSGLPVVQSANAGITGYYTNGKEKKLETWVIDCLNVDLRPVKPDVKVLAFKSFFEKFSIVFSLIFLVFYRFKNIFSLK
ncbi:MAG: apolipoprotein N-acyltransferase [Actinobacteria bacterium]|nr:apolipoprotein N-acyltransferase [Actinomycetota bacterium]